MTENKKTTEAKSVNPNITHILNSYPEIPKEVADSMSLLELADCIGEHQRKELERERNQPEILNVAQAIINQAGSEE